MNIDWSKAQEGTTHAFTDEDRGSVQWRRNVGDQWFAYTKTYGWEEIVGRPEVYIARPETTPETNPVAAASPNMIRRAQAEALLKLAEALEECERNWVSIRPGSYVNKVCTESLESYLEDGLNGTSVRFFIASYYPKSEAAE